MFGELEQGERAVTGEERAKYIEKLFELTTATPYILELYKPISVEDYEFCIDYVKRLKENIPKLLAKLVENN